MTDNKDSPDSPNQQLKSNLNIIVRIQPTSTVFSYFCEQIGKEMSAKKKSKPKIETHLPKEKKKSSVGGFVKILFWVLILFAASIIISYLIS